MIGPRVSLFKIVLPQKLRFHVLLLKVIFTLLAFLAIANGFLFFTGPGHFSREFRGVQNLESSDIDHHGKADAKFVLSNLLKKINRLQQENEEKDRKMKLFSKPKSPFLF